MADVTPIRPTVATGGAELEGGGSTLLEVPHLQPLEPYRRRVAVPGRSIPRFDPRDGGVAARLMILLETPAAGARPLAVVSRDNATGTARNLRTFLAEAGIARRDTLIWNAVPWVVHAPGATNRSVRARDLAEGLATLPHLLSLLPRLNLMILAGRAARSAEAVIRAQRPDAAIILMPHPSPTYVCTSPTVRERIMAALHEARRLLDRPE